MFFGSGGPGGPFPGGFPHPFGGAGGGPPEGGGAVDSEGFEVLQVPREASAAGIKKA